MSSLKVAFFSQMDQAAQVVNTIHYFAFWIPRLKLFNFLLSLRQFFLAIMAPDSKKVSFLLPGKGEPSPSPIFFLFKGLVFLFGRRGGATY